VEWLLGRWRGLSSSLEHRGGWTMRQIHAACDLLGIRPEERAYHEQLTLGDVESTRAMIAAEGGRLGGLLAGGLAAPDEQRREVAAEGLGLEEAPALRLARRYLGEAYRGLEKAFAKFEAGGAGGSAAIEAAGPEEAASESEEPSGEAAEPAAEVA